MAFNPTIPGYSTQGKSFSRTAAFPLESYEIWTDLEALKAYAANTDASKDPSYIGQKVAYIDIENNRVVHYGIEIDGTLKELGADKMGVEALDKEDGGKIPKAFYVVDAEAEGEEGTEDYKPEVGHVEIRWVTPEAFEDTNTVTTLEAADKSVNVTATKDDTIDKNYKVKVNISEEEGNSLSLKEDGLYVTVPEVTHPEYAIKKLDEATEGSVATYKLTKDGEEVEEAIEVIDFTVTMDGGVDYEATEDAPAFKRHTFSQCGKTIGTIDIPKDLLVSSGSVKEVAEDDKPYEGAKTGDKYIELVLNNNDALYIPANDLVEYITTDNTKSVELTLDTDHKLTADLKVSGVEGNRLSISDDGAYVAPIVAGTNLQYTDNDTLSLKDNITVETAKIAGADFTADPDDATNGNLFVTSQGNIHLNTNGTGVYINGALAATVNDIPYVKIEEAEEGTDTTADSIAVIASLATNEDHIVVPTTVNVASKAGLDAIKALVGTPATEEGEAADGLYGEIAALALRVDGKVDTATAIGTNKDGIRFISQTEINKLAALNLEGNEITISGSVNASQVKELDPRIVDIVTGTGTYVVSEAVGEEGDEGYIPAVLGNKLAIERGAQVNKIESIGLPDATLAISDKHVSIPTFLAGKYGVIKGAAEGSVNTVIAQADGTGKVEKVSTDTLVQGAEELVLFGGNSGANA